MAISPEDYAIPEGYRHWHGGEAEDYLGLFCLKVEDGIIHTAFRVEARHCNAHGSLHGGVMMAFADYTLCIAANGGEAESVATVSCNNEFVSPAFEGDLVLGRSEAVRKGRSLVFTRGELQVDNKPILTCSGVIKLLKKR